MSVWYFQLKDVISPAVHHECPCRRGAVLEHRDVGNVNTKTQQVTEISVPIFPQPRVECRLYPEKGKCIGCVPAAAAKASKGTLCPQVYVERGIPGGRQMVSDLTLIDKYLIIGKRP